MEIFSNRLNTVNMDIKNGNTQVVFDVSGISYESYGICLDYISKLVFDMDSVGHRVIKKTSNSNPKRKMEELDPELFDFKTSDGVSYSRICQKKFRPIGVYTNEEYTDMTEKQKADKILFEHQNMTTGEPIYYECSQKHPYFGYIVDKHPKGYCLPKCKQTETDGVKNLVKSLCSSKFMVKEDDLDETNMHSNIIKFGKKLHPGRFSFVHESIYSSLKMNKHAKLIMGHQEDSDQLIALIRGVAAPMGLTVKSFLTDITSKLTPELYEDMALEFNISYEDALEHIQDIGDGNGTNQSMSFITSMIYFIYNIAVVIYDVTTYDPRELLDSSNSSVSVRFHDYMNFSTIHDLRAFVRLRKTLYPITSGMSFTEKYSEKLMSMFVSQYIKNMKSKDVKGFNKYPSIESDPDVKILKKFISKNKVINVLAEYERHKICIGVSNSVNLSVDSIPAEYVNFPRNLYNINPKNTIQYLFDNGVQVQNMIFICKKDKLFDMVSPGDRDKCNFIGVRVKDDYFWFRDSTLRDLGIKERIKVEFMIYDIDKVNKKLAKHKPSSYEVPANSEIYYHMYIYKLYKSEIYKILSRYKNPKLWKDLNKAISGANVKLNVTELLPHSSKKILTRLNNGRKIDDVIVREDVEMLWEDLQSDTLSIVTELTKHISNITKNVINSEINITKLTFHYPITPGKNNFTMKTQGNDNMFYTSGKLNILESLYKPMMTELSKEFKNKLIFVEQIYRHDVHIIRIISKSSFIPMKK
ncbi:unnamed protein product [Ascophyllum nodosum]